MKNTFGYEGLIYNSLMLISNLIILNLLFIVSIVPIVTIGASLNALYATADNLSIDKLAAVVKDYFYHFRKSFYKGTQIFIILFLFFAVAAGGMYFAVVSELTFLTFLTLFIFSHLLLISFIIFPMNVFYDVDMKQLFIKAAVLLQTDLLVVIFIFLSAVSFFIVIPVLIPQLIILYILFGFSGLALFHINIIRKRLI